MNDSYNANSLLLGKLPAKHDERSITLKKLLIPTNIPEIPTTFNVEKSLSINDNFMFANDRYGDCVIACRARTTLVWEKLQQGVQIPIADKEVINEYLSESGGEDKGLVLITSLNQWRQKGWKVGERVYRIHAYASVDWKDHLEVMQASYLLNGLVVGMLVPRYAMNGFMSGGRFWDTQNTNTEIIGGHCIFGNGYEKISSNLAGINDVGPIIMTWGEHVQLTWAFWDIYVDECYVVIAERDIWLGENSPINIPKLEQLLVDVTGKNPQPDLPPPTLNNIVVLPTTTTMNKGESMQLNAVGVYSDGNSVDITLDCSWYSSNPHIIGIISAGALLAFEEGQSSVYAMKGNLRSNVCTLTVNNPVQLVRLIVKPIVGLGSIDFSEPSHASGGFWFIKGSTIKITATPKKGYEFSMWGDDYTAYGILNPIYVTMDRDKSISVYFTKVVDPTPVDPTPVDPTPVDPTPPEPIPPDPTPPDPVPPTPEPVHPHKHCWVCRFTSWVWNLFFRWPK